MCRSYHHFSYQLRHHWMSLMSRSMKDYPTTTLIPRDTTSTKCFVNHSQLLEEKQQLKLETEFTPNFGSVMMFDIIQYPAAQNSREGTDSESLTDTKWRQLHSVHDQRRMTRKQTEANEYFPPREAKRNIIKNSVKRAKHLNTQKDGPGSSKDSVNAIYEPNIFVGEGDVLQFPGSIAHCVSSDFQMAKGVAKQINSPYPCIRPTIKSIETPINGSSVSVSLPWENESIFNLVTKSQFFDKPTYYDLSRSLNCIKQQLL